MDARCSARCATTSRCSACACLELSLAQPDLGALLLDLLHDASGPRRRCAPRNRAGQEVVEARRTEDDLERRVLPVDVERHEALLQVLLSDPVGALRDREVPLVLLDVRLDLVEAEIGGVPGLDGLLDRRCRARRSARAPPRRPPALPGSGPARRQRCRQPRGPLARTASAAASQRFFVFPPTIGFTASKNLVWISPCTSRGKLPAPPDTGQMTRCISTQNRNTLLTENPHR